MKSKVMGVGVEYRQDLVKLCNQIAKACSFDNLEFVEGSIEGFNAFDDAATKIVIALHACDTATDDAIFKGISQGAELIVVAPCCHKQIRKQMEQTNQTNKLSPLTSYGIFLERQAEMLTDTMRALILEQHGYQTKVVEFISDAHTPKNILLIASKNSSHSTPHKRCKEAEQELVDLKRLFGIKAHYLEHFFENKSTTE